jgi:putative heme-binding domain-containing protein
MGRRTLFAGWLFALSTLANAQSTNWIWHDNKGEPIKPEEVRFFRKVFHVETLPTKAVLSVAADDDAMVFLNGKQVARPRDFDKPAYEDVTESVRKGDNVLAIRGHNTIGDQAGIVAILELKYRKGSQFVVTDTNWVSWPKDVKGWRTPEFDDSAWTKVESRGKLGDQPWGETFKPRKATPAESLSVVPGFKVELIRSADIGEGSWICMTADQFGRLIISPQSDSQPLLRITVSRSGQVRKVEKIPAPVHQAMGLLYAHNSLYVNGHGPKGTGLYRLIDENHNDRFEPNEVHFLKKFEGEGEHGPHAVMRGPDGKIYIMNGNHTKLPKGILPDSPHKNYKEDFLLSRQWDPGGHAVGILAPGGYIVRADPEGRKWELLLAGFRNCYDFAFSPGGEIFTFDSDMEWDWGTPWYRPTRIIHAVDGGEYGWRSGSGKWPEYYPDSLPPVFNIGVGSPTGVKFGTKSNFPEAYRSALFAFDWSYGRIFAVHLKPHGSTYDADVEVFLKGKPLNLTTLCFGKGGAMYFITGGRGTQSGLYRVSYVGRGSSPSTVAQASPPASSEDVSPEIGAVGQFLGRPAGETPAKPAGGDACPTSPEACAKARALRHQLEALHGKKDPRAIDFAWPHLDSEDRFIRYAARIAIEWQDVDLWKKRALVETNVNAGLTALMALARCGGKETQRDLLMALKQFPLDSLSVTQKLAKLRIIEVSFIRQGKPDEDLAKLATEKLNHIYPSDNELLNRELSQLLIYLEAPDVVTKTLALLDKAKTQEEQAHYIFYLRKLKSGWTLEQRKHYFEWFHFAVEASQGEVTYPQGSPYLVWANQQKAAERHPPELLRWFKEADREYGDGASYPKYLTAIRKEAIAALSEEDRVALGSLVADEPALAFYKLIKPRSFVREWSMADLESSLDQTAHGRDFQNGKAAFNDAQCILCHRMANQGGSVGPELTGAASKYSGRDILESILQPSKVISEQYQNTTILKKDGESTTGRIVDEDDKKVVVQTNPLGSDREEIPKSEIAERHASKVSPMPEGLANQLTKEEILDLLAYIQTGGKEKALNFKKEQTVTRH